MRKLKLLRAFKKREFNFVSNIIEYILYISINNKNYKYPINIGSGKSIKIKFSEKNKVIY